MKQWLAILLGVALSPSFSAASVHYVYSPNGRLKAEIRIGQSLSYRIFLDEEPVLLDSPLSLETAEDGDLALNPDLRELHSHRVNRWIHPPNPLWNSAIHDIFNQSDFAFATGLHLIVRVADDGVAMRFTTQRSGPLTIINELFTFNVKPQSALYGPALDCTVHPGDAPDCSQNSYENRYQSFTPETLTSNTELQMPSVIHDRRFWLALSEAEIFDFPGSALVMKNGLLSLIAARAPRKIATQMMMTWNLDVVKERQPYLAKYADGDQELPWRVIQVARHERELVGRDFLSRLGDKSLRLSEAQDWSWVQPGFTTDEWIISSKLGLDPKVVGFTPGLNTATYKYYVDFAADQGFPYIIIDDGWTNASNQKLLNPDIDVPEIVSYAHARGVGIILWAEYWAVVRDLEGTLDRFQNLGVAGIELDMLQRDDVDMIRFQERFMQETARRHLHAMIHGCGKPTGLHLRYPNLIAIEAGLGHEYNKGSKVVTPRHKLDLAMLRSLEGPFDYEGGSMLNAQPENFVVDNEKVEAQGTRVNELAMTLILPSPLQVVAGDLTDYQADPNMLEFYHDVPTTWDETRVLSAEFGEYLVLAKRKGSDWYFVALNAGESRTLTLDVSFLHSGDLSVLSDGPNADTDARDYVAQSIAVPKNRRLIVQMARNGGWVARTIH